MNKRNLTGYKAYIVDMDGTLYRQTPLRLCMLRELILYYSKRPLRIKELMMIKRYREIREKALFSTESASFEDNQRIFLAKKYNMSCETVKGVIKKWMEVVPLKYISKYRNEELILFLNHMVTLGRSVVVYSDYPVLDKVRAVNIKPSYAFYSGDKEIMCMKPDVRGLKNVLQIISLRTDDVLYIGDRDSKDGKCAGSLGIDYINVKKNRIDWGKAIKVHENIEKNGEE